MATTKRPTVKKAVSAKKTARPSEATVKKIPAPAATRATAVAAKPAKTRKPFPVKIFLAGLAALVAGVLLFIVAPGNEPLTFLGFALVLAGLAVPTVVLLRRVLRKVLFWLPAAVVAALLIFALSLSAYIVFFFPNETVRQLVQTEMSKTLSRPVSIGALKVSLLEGITLTDLKILDRDGKSPFVSASLVLSYKILPLLTGQIVVDKAVLESPAITIRRSLVANKAVMNIDDLLAGGGGTPAIEEKKQVAASTGSAAPSLPFSISVGEIGLRNGSVTIDDRGTKGFANEYVLDKLDCLASDISWPMTHPLGVRFNFRISMRELGNTNGKTFNVMPGIKGRMLLKNVAGAMVPEGTIEFGARDGLFYGQQFLTKATAFLDQLKRDFFGSISRETEKRINEFEGELKKKVAVFSGEATKRVDTIVADAQKKYTDTAKKLAAKRDEAVKDLADSVTKTTGEIDAAANKLTADINAAFEKIAKVYPAAKTKLKAETYTSKAKAKADAVKQDFTAFGKGTTDGLAQDIGKIIADEKASFDKYVASLKSGLDASITKYAALVRAEFRKQMTNAENFVNKFELDIPFLRKKMSFDEALATLSITNGRAAFKGLKIGSAEFRVEADGSYGLLDGSIQARARLSLDAKLAKNALLGIFAGKDGRPEIAFEIATAGDTFSFKLLGEPIATRMRDLAAAKAGEYMKDYIAKNVTLDAFLKQLGGSSATADGKPEQAIDAAKTSRKTALDTGKKRRTQALVDEGKTITKTIETDAKKAAASILPGKLGKFP